MMKSSEEPLQETDGRWRVDPDAFADLVVEGMQRGVRNAVMEHHRAGNPVAIWRDGQVVLLHPDGSVQPVNGPEARTREE
jgi:hypothetical protein